MSEIRKKSIQGSIWIYLGFFIGAINTYIFTHKEWFSPEQYGLTRTVLELSMLMFSFSAIGTTFFLYKFFPYYEDNLEKKDNDILGLAIKISGIGFLITILILLIAEPLVIKKFGTNSKLLIEYFYITIPLAFFVLVYNLLESYSLGFGKAVTANILKETVLKFYTLILVLLKVFGIIDFHIFMLLFACQFALIVTIFVYILKRDGQLWLTFKTSKVTKKYRKKIVSMLSLTFIVLVVTILRTSIDSLVLAARQSLASVAIFGFASYLVILMQAPYRSIVSITIPILSRNWKEKNIQEISRIYKRSSINLLTFSLFIFCLIRLNFDSAIHFFNLNIEYLDGKNVFILLGVVTIIEMGTGVNGQIIGTSSFFKFELWTNFLLTAMIIPLSYFLTVKYGLIGPAIANLVSFTIYNGIRYVFLLKKFNMQPFSKKTVEIFVIAVVGYLLCYFLISKADGLVYIIARTVLFSAFFIVAVNFRNISPDVKPVLYSLLERVKKINNK